jgi:NAD(P)-dependent dehydrogenase (short-subunit alcohol dehydrogenase family)
MGDRSASAAEAVARSATKFILVTGAAGGIGRATVARLAEAGHIVFAAERREGDLVVEHPNVHTIVLDVTDRSSIDAAVERVRVGSAGRGLDVLVNTAGILVLGPVEAVPEELTRKQFDVNVFGLLEVTRAFLPPMRERGSGRIVNVSSVLGRFALPGSGVYSASKFALEAVSDALRVELAPFGVRVVLVEPGVVDTGLYRSADEELSRYHGSLDAYRATWSRGFAFPQRLMRQATSSEEVANVVTSAALARNPRARYRPGLRDRLNVSLLTRLPTGVADTVKARLVGIKRRRRARAIPNVPRSRVT